MNQFVLISALLITIAITAEAILDGGVITVPAAVVGILALKAAAGAVGIGIGSLGQSRGSKSSRRGRSVQVEETFLKASIDDADDCAKKLVCLLNTESTESLDSDEQLLRGLFANADEIDVAKDTVEFDLASLMGRKAGSTQCKRIYARCPFNGQQLMEVFRSPEFVNFV